MAGTRLEFANVSTVTENLWVGGDIDVFDAALAQQQLAELVGSGVSLVIDCRLEASDARIWQAAPGVDFCWHPVDDAGQQIPAAWFEVGVTRALEHLQRPGAIVLTHCHMGINRGPSLAFAVLLGLGWEPVSAIDAIRAARPIANVWYAEDALAWHHRRSGATTAQIQADRSGLRAWRRDNPLDVVRIIADVRRREVC